MFQLIFIILIGLILGMVVSYLTAYIIIAPDRRELRERDKSISLWLSEIKQKMRKIE